MQTSYSIPGDKGLCIVRYEHMYFLLLWIPFSKTQKVFDHGRTRTYNPQIRSLVPYPLGHAATSSSCIQRKHVLSKKEWRRKRRDTLGEEKGRTFPLEGSKMSWRRGARRECVGGRDAENGVLEKGGLMKLSRNGFSRTTAEMKTF